MFLLSKNGVLVGLLISFCLLFVIGAIPQFANLDNDREDVDSTDPTESTEPLETTEPTEEEDGNIINIDNIYNDLFSL
jgi:hypothetical protein